MSTTSANIIKHCYSVCSASRLLLMLHDFCVFLVHYGVLNFLNFCNVYWFNWSLAKCRWIFTHLLCTRVPVIIQEEQGG